MRFIFTIIALGICGISWSYNYIFLNGFGRTPIEAMTLGAGAVMLDMFKNYLPILMRDAGRDGEYVRFGLSGLGYGALVALSLIATMGYFGELRFGKSNGVEKKQNDLVTWKDELKDNKNDLDQLGVTDIPARVQAALDKMQTNRRWNSTKQCKDATTKKSRTFCGNYHKKQGELAVAKQAAILKTKIAELKIKIENSDITANASEQAAGAYTIAKLTGLKIENAQIGIILLMTVTLEFFAGLAFFLLGSKQTARSKRKPKRKKPLKAKKSLPVGDLTEYVAECLKEKKGRSTEITGAYEVYIMWCKVNNFEPANNDNFETGMTYIAQELDWQIDKNKKGQPVIQNVHNLAAA